MLDQRRNIDLILYPYLVFAGIPLGGPTDLSDNHTDRYLPTISVLTFHDPQVRWSDNAALTIYLSRNVVGQLKFKTMLEVNIFFSSAQRFI